MIYLNLIKWFISALNLEMLFVEHHFIEIRKVYPNRGCQTLR